MCDIAATSMVAEGVVCGAKGYMEQRFPVRARDEPGGGLISDSVGGTGELGKKDLEDFPEQVLAGKKKELASWFDSNACKEPEVSDSPGNIY